MPILPQWVSLLVTSLLSVTAGAVLTASLALKRFHRERWWERKAEAYSKIIEALHHAAHCLSEWADEDSTREKISDERQKQLADGFSRAFGELEKATGIGAYIISEDSAKVLRELATKIRRCDANFEFPRDPLFEIYEAKAKAYREALETVRTLAKRDLGVK